METISGIALINSGTPEARATAERIARLWGMVRVIPVITTNPEDLDRIARGDGAWRVPEAIFAVGGDGFLLETVRRFHSTRGFRIPICGWNAGQVGFHMNDVPADDAALAERLHAVATGRYDRETLYPLVLWVHRRSADGSLYTEAMVAFNEIAFMPKDPGRAVRLEFSVDGVPMGTHSGDGLIVSSAQGTTGWAVAARGPAMDPAVPAIVIVPSNPHPAMRFAQLLFPLVLAPTRRVTVRVADAEHRPVTATVDGRQHDGIIGADITTDVGQELPLTVELLTLRDADGRSMFARRIVEKFLRDGGGP